MNELKIFESSEFGNIRTEMDVDKPLFAASDVASALGYKKPSEAVTAHCKNYRDSRGLFAGNGIALKVIDESDVYRLVFRSKLPNAEKFQDWVFDDVLPSLRKTGSYLVAPSINDQLAFAEAVARIMSLQGSALLGMMRRVQDNNNLPNILPNYTEDKPANAIDDKGSYPTNSASALLKANNIKMSAVKFNKLAIEHGFLEEKVRVSTKTPDKIKTYKAITEKGFPYGKNVTNDRNQSEVSPRWYESEFSKLLDILLGVK